MGRTVVYADAALLKPECAPLHGFYWQQPRQQIRLLPPPPPPFSIFRRFLLCRLLNYLFSLSPLSFPFLANKVGSLYALPFLLPLIFTRMQTILSSCYFVKPIMIYCIWKEKIELIQLLNNNCSDVLYKCKILLNNMHYHNFR